LNTSYKQVVYNNNFVRRKQLAIQMCGAVLASNQPDAQCFYNTFIYLNSLYVSSNYVLILRRTIVWIQLLV